MDKIKILIKTITPIIIKSGDSFSPVEFFLGKENLYHFDIKKILNSPLSNDFKKAIDEELKTSLNNNSYFNSLKNFYKTYFSQLQKYVIEKIPLAQDVNWQSVQTMKIDKFIRYYDMEINKELPYIPGSSIKGAFLEAFFKTNKIFQKQDKDYLASFIGFTDFYFKNYSSIISKISRFHTKKNILQVSIYVELIEGEAEGELYFPKRKENINYDDIVLTIDNIFKLGGRYYKWKKDRFFNNFSRSFREIIFQKNGLILPIGFGSGSYEKYGRSGITYYSYSRNFPYDPIGAVELIKI